MNQCVMQVANKGDLLCFISGMQMTHRQDGGIIKTQIENNIECN